MNIEDGYLKALQQILARGSDKETRNGKTRSLFAIQLRHDMKLGFPALTTKKLAFKAVKSELLWFLDMKYTDRANDEMLKTLNGSEKTIWSANADSDYWKSRATSQGDLGRIYGIQWRQWISPESLYFGDKEMRIDQLGDVIEKIKTDPNNRRLVVSAWNPGELDQMALPPCHMMFQFYVDGEKLSLHMIQRSADMFLGVPFNIASYALLLSMVAQVTNKVPDELVLTLNDAHIYHDHFDAVKEQLTRKPYELPGLELRTRQNIDDFSMEDIELANYQYHPTIKAPMAV